MVSINGPLPRRPEPLTMLAQAPTDRALRAAGARADKGFPHRHQPKCGCPNAAAQRVQRRRRDAHVAAADPCKPRLDWLRSTPSYTRHPRCATTGSDERPSRERAAVGWLCLRPHRRRRRHAAAQQQRVQGARCCAAVCGGSSCWTPQRRQGSKGICHRAQQTAADGRGGPTCAWACLLPWAELPPLSQPRRRCCCCPP